MCCVSLCAMTLQTVMMMSDDIKMSCFIRNALPSCQCVICLVGGCDHLIRSFDCLRICLSVCLCGSVCAAQHSPSQSVTTAHDVQDDAVIVLEPVDLLLTCVRQVLVLAQPRDRQVPDSIVGMADGDTTPSILRPAAEASQEASPDQVSHKVYAYTSPPLLQHTNLSTNQAILCSTR